ncbi:hypothetical protein EYF80_037725 [Liparis tanakae]|uniref:Secreted protein n=1 Tax=Liparis tanakae TaxID=230148 RepID=A0A4Z2GFY0_9TELE|nr:hypothetical protein EYF80_037725 [Liparis tanakae]
MMMMMVVMMVMMMGVQIFLYCNLCAQNILRHDHTVFRGLHVFSGHFMGFYALRLHTFNVYLQAIDNLSFQTFHFHLFLKALDNAFHLKFVLQEDSLVRHHIREKHTLGHRHHNVLAINVSQTPHSCNCKHKTQSKASHDLDISEILQFIAHRDGVIGCAEFTVYGGLRAQGRSFVLDLQPTNKLLQLSYLLQLPPCMFRTPFFFLLLLLLKPRLGALLEASRTAIVSLGDHAGTVRDHHAPSLPGGREGL